LRDSHLCHGDFANTASWHASEQPAEQIQNYDELVDWAQEKGILTGEQAESLRCQAQTQPRDAEALREHAIDLRETIYRIFAAVAHGESPDPSDIATLNGALCGASQHFQVVESGPGYAWDWHDSQDALDAMLWPIVHSTADLLTSGDLNRIGQCADDRGCGWLFFDTSKNRSRRWCSMEDCGNRAKARLHYSRARSLKE
jgi:predicted RNA-binding Zn ribbon-like protein